MANNNIELITKYSTEAWDEVYKADARSALLDKSNSLVKWTGAKTVKIARIELTGMGNYYRPNDALHQDGEYNTADPYSFGYAAGEMGLIWDDYTIRYDRSQRIPVEMFDDEETNGLALGAATKELSRVIIVPEVDALCFSEIASHASVEKGNLVSGTFATGDTADSLAALNTAFLYFAEREVPAEDQIIFASPKYINALRNNKNELSRVLLQGDFSKDVRYTLTKYEGREIAEVPSSRFRTDIHLDRRGYAWKPTSKEIDFMVVAKSAVTHIVKYNKVQIISGDMNLAGNNFDGSTIYARIYHDVFVPKNKEYGIYVHVGGFADAVTGQPAGAVIAEVKDSKVANLETVGAGLNGIKLKYYTTTETKNVGEVMPVGATEVKRGSALTAGTTVYAVSTDTSKVLAKGTAKTVAAVAEPADKTDEE